MIRKPSLCCLLLLALGVSVPLHAAVRRYARPRAADVLHLRIDVTPDFATRSVLGLTEIRCRPLGTPLTVWTLDACDLDVREVWAEPPLRAWDADDSHLAVTFREPVALDAEAVVHVRYAAEPRRGLYFRTPELGYDPCNLHLFTQGEAHEAPHWYPCYDYPNDRFTSEILCRVPPDLTVLSNGRCLSEEVDPSTGLKVSHWRQDQPHVNYLVALAAGRFTGLHAEHGDTPLGFYVPATYRDQAARAFAQTADIMAFFEREIGVPYPWVQYNQVAVEDFVAGGMENTSLTILTHRTLATADTGRLASSTSLVAHEMAHQWFGDYVTCRDWTNLWLNEGFATYYAHLYAGYHEGSETLRCGLERDARQIFGAGKNEPPIFHRTFGSPDQQFDYRAYRKGSWVLHMLRERLGETRYRRCIRTYLERHALGIVRTADLQTVIEELTGQSWDRFFDEWVFYAGYPRLNVRYAWDAATGRARLDLHQSVSQPGGPAVFHLPLRIRFHGATGTTDHVLTLDRPEQTLYVPLTEKPRWLRVDPNTSLLVDVDFRKPTAMLLAQLACDDDPVGQLRALEALESKTERRVVTALRGCLERARFHRVRVRAAQALGRIHDEPAYEALLAARDTADERVRSAVFTALARFHRARTLDLLLAQADAEPNPRIRADVLRALGAYDDPRVDATLTGALIRPSYQNRLAQAAVEGLARRADPDLAEPLLRALTARSREFTVRGLARALEVLGRLARAQEGRDTVRRLLVGYLDDPRYRVQIGALRGLGALRDPQAAGAIESLSEDRVGAVARAAQEARSALRKETPLAPDELVKLRTRVDDLAAANRKLRARLDALDARLEGTPADANETSE